MAETGESEYIEGFNDAGRDLARITQQPVLLDLLKETNAARNEVDNILSREMDSLQKLQNTLNHVNDEFLKKTAELDGMKRKQQVSLDQSRKNELAEVMKGTLDNYLERRPTDPNDKRSVHVYFLTGEEIGSELHVGREGAGSRDATFIVTLSQSVQSLATQAAKYWGLDPEKVFFLDRDGRIVQGKMSLSDIILPPLAPDQVEANSAGIPQQDSTAIVPAGGGGGSTALAVKTGDEGQIAFTVKGRDYSLTLVRAKTVLTKEDLSQPKGEKWNDFTFDQQRLNEDLEMTRKKRGDPDPQDMKVGMDSIPSLYDLIKQGNLRKFQKNADKWCRIFELTIFLVVWALFFFLLKPNSQWDLHMTYAGKGIVADMSTFTLAEHSAHGMHDYTDIISSNHYARWVQGPLRRAVFPYGLDSKNAYVLKVQGRIYAEAAREMADVNWCGNGTSSSNDTNSSNGSLVDADGGVCYPVKLKSCPSKGVVELMGYALDAGQEVPECRQPYDHDPFITAIKSAYSVDAFSFYIGRVSSYLGGTLYNFNLTSWTAFNESIAAFLSTDGTLEPPAKLVNVLTYVPVLNGVHLTQFLTEFTGSGPIITTRKSTIINLAPGEPWEAAFYTVAIILSLIVLLLELRRITGFPKRFFYEEKREPCSLGVLLFLVVPLLLIFSFAIMVRQGESTKDTILSLSDDTLLPSDADSPPSLFPSFIAKADPYQWTASEKSMHMLQVNLWLDAVKMLVDLITLLLMMVLAFRYALVYFPEMRYTTMMIKRVAKPVLVTLSLLIIAMAGFAVLFYLVFSEQQFEFRNWLGTTMSVFQFTHGGFTEWEKLYNEYAWTWYILMIASFLVFTLNLNNILIAVLVSHKKEAELQKNYSSHPFWQMLHRDHMQSGDNKEVNPALAGYDFGNPVYKDGPVKVTEEPGWKI